MIRPSLVLLGVAIGVVLGVFYGWVVSPVRYADTEPAALRADYKEQYALLIASAHARDGDVERARRRLASLGEGDPARAVTALAQRLAAEGGDPSALVDLAAALGAGVAPFTPAATLAASPTQVEPTSTPVPTATPPPPATATPPGTPTATPVVDYELIVQERYCSDLERKPLIIVDVVDAQGRAQAGTRVVVRWAQGQDSFVTGLKPEISASYGDFLMDVGTTYTVQIGSRSPPVTGLTAPLCTAADGTSYRGAVRLVFQRGR